jgi:hypothetical protein
LIEEIFTGKKGSGYFKVSNWFKIFRLNLNNIFAKLGQVVNVISA